LYDLFGAFGGGCQRQTKASKVVNAEILMCVNYPQTAKKKIGKVFGGVKGQSAFPPLSLIWCALKISTLLSTVQLIQYIEMILKTELIQYEIQFIILLLDRKFTQRNAWQIRDGIFHIWGLYLPTSQR